MTERSQNGWPASRTLPTRAITINGATFRIADNDDVETVFRYVVTQFAETVEGLIPAHCFGYNYRPNVNNPSRLSNHSSGTALDINSAEHPNGATTRSTFTVHQVAACHAILASIPELGETVHWGGDWSSPLTTDAMHWELHSHDLEQLHRVAERIRALEDTVTPDDIAAIAKALLDDQTVTLRKVDGSTKEISVRNALERILNPDES